VRDGATLAEARAQIDAIQADITARHPDGMQVTAQLTPLPTRVVGSVGRPMLLLLSAVAAVLLIVCVNLANLTLAHDAGRTRESAVRIALGAGAGRVARLALAQSLILALTGGALGLVLAYWGLRAVVATAPATLPRIDEVQLDMRVFAVAALLATIVGLFVGALPALRLTRSNPADTLRAGGRSATDGRRCRSRASSPAPRRWSSSSPWAWRRASSRPSARSTHSSPRTRSAPRSPDR